MKRLALLPILALGVALGCGSSGPGSGFSDRGTNNNNNGGDDGGTGNDNDGGDIIGGGDLDAAGTEECTKMDIVFVIDNSGSMSQEQANLTANFPKFIQLLNDFKTKTGRSLDYRVAVTTTDITGDRGRFRTTGQGGCNGGPSRPWLEKSDGDISAPFSCRAVSGTGGSSTEQGLTAMRMALTDRMSDGTNKAGGQDFLREDALMAFVILSDEDESNTTAISSFPPIFDQVKKERARWAAAVIAGEAGGCSSAQLGNASDARRYREFISLIGQNGVFSSICAGDLTIGLQKAMQTFSEACKKINDPR
jgi:hypothetical protein